MVVRALSPSKAGRLLPGSTALAGRLGCSSVGLAHIVPGMELFWGFAALAAVAAAVADEAAAAGATTGAEDRGVEFLGAQLVS